jgi:hypothetical protein
MEDLDTRISDFLQSAQPAPIDFGSLVENAENMGLARATAVAIAQSDHRKAAEFVALLADFLTQITVESDGMVVSDGFIAAQLLWHVGPRALTAIPALEYCLGLDGREYDLIRWLRLMAAEAKWRITGDPAIALTVATEMLKDEEWWLVGHAADLLGKLGQAARPVVADLERLLGHEQDYTRRHVRAAIERVLSS